MAKQIEYAATTPSIEARSASIVPANIRAEVDRLNLEERTDEDKELRQRVNEVCKRAGLPTL